MNKPDVVCCLWCRKPLWELLPDHTYRCVYACFAIGTLGVEDTIDLPVAVCNEHVELFLENAKRMIADFLKKKT